MYLADKHRRKVLKLQGLNKKQIEEYMDRFKLMEERFGERQFLKNTTTTARYSTKCKHKWQFLKGGWFTSDKFICEKCGGFKELR